jgi:hypothetical protein
LAARNGKASASEQRSDATERARREKGLRTAKYARQPGFRPVSHQLELCAVPPKKGFA